MGIMKICYYEMAVVLVTCKNTVKLLYVPPKYMWNVFANGKVFPDFISQKEAKKQRKLQTGNKE